MKKFIEENWNIKVLKVLFDEQFGGCLVNLGRRINVLRFFDSKPYETVFPFPFEVRPCEQKDKLEWNELAEKRNQQRLKEDQINNMNIVLKEENEKFMIEKSVLTAKLNQKDEKIDELRKLLLNCLEEQQENEKVKIIELSRYKQKLEILESENKALTHQLNVQNGWTYL